MKLGRNDPCHCGSGKKYKKCHATEDQAKRSAELSALQAAAIAAKEAEDAESEKGAKSGAKSGPKRQALSSPKPAGRGPTTAANPIRRKAV